MNNPESALQDFSGRWSPEALKAVGRLDFIAREVLDGVRQGLHRSLRRGFSSEFFDYKNYQDGDDASKIDWRLFAKTDKFFIKRYEAETNLECMILPDFSRSMLWRWKNTVSKYDYTLMLSASLALLFSLQRDLVGIHTFGIAPGKHIRPRASVKQTESLFSALSVDPVSADWVNVEGLLHTARGLRSVLAHKGLIVVVSDFEMQENELRESISLLRSRGDEVVLFHLLDKAEIDLPFDGATHIQDSETGELLSFNSVRARQKHRAIVEEFRETVRRCARSSGSCYVPVDTSESPVAAILRMGECRKEMI